MLLKDVCCHCYCCYWHMSDIIVTGYCLLLWSLGDVCYHCYWQMSVIIVIDRCMLLLLLTDVCYNCYCVMSVTVVLGGVYYSIGASFISVCSCMRFLWNLLWHVNGYICKASKELRDYNQMIAYIVLWWYNYSLNY